MTTKTYKIFLKKTDKNVIEDLLLIREGFNYWAFIFQIFYLLYKKMWVLSLLLFGVFLFLNILYSLNVINVYILTGLNLAIYLYIGFECQDWYTKKLIHDRYEYLGYSSGLDEKDAKLKFLDHVNESSSGEETMTQKFF